MGIFDCNSATTNDMIEMLKTIQKWVPGNRSDDDIKSVMIR